MAAKKPLANYAGTIKELQAGDTVTGLGGSLLAYKANGTQDNIDLLDGGGITVLPIAQGGTGAATGPAALISLGAREVLTAARTYYVATTGSNSNNGLTVGAPFLTIQKAVDVVCSLDMSIYQVTIQVADGTHTTGVVLGHYVGSLAPLLLGNASTPANCTISTTSAHAIALDTPTIWNISGFKLQTTTFGSCLEASLAGTLSITGPMEYGACANNHMLCRRYGVINISAGYTISAGVGIHAAVTECGLINFVSTYTVTVTNTPAFATAFLYMRTLGVYQCNGVVFSGSATGARYNISLNSVCFANGNVLPGSVAGTTVTGGQYG